jgi:hypothetical protein
MAIKPINDSVEEHFTKIFLEAQAEEMRQYKENIAGKFLQLNHYQTPKYYELFFNFNKSKKWGAYTDKFIIE